MRAAHELPDLEWPAPARSAPLVLAYSGGLDSTVLLHHLSGQAHGRLRVLHVHHGLQDTADAWARHCQAQAAALSVPMAVLRVRVVRDGRGTEAGAREARYEALRRHLRVGDVLVTAHHAEDQAETVLLNLLRGSGVAGLAGMRAWSAFEPGFLWRPLLETSRRQLRIYAESRGLAWIEDPHNRDPAYARSRLRQQVWPVIEAGWPQAAPALMRGAANLREAADLLDELADADLVALQGPDPAALSVSALAGVSAARRRNALRRWLARQGLPVPFRDSLLRLDRELLGARPDAAPVVGWPGLEWRRYRDALYAMPPLSEAEGYVVDWDGNGWDGSGTLDLPERAGHLEMPAEGAAVPGRVRTPAPGERFRPRGAGQRQRLKNLFQARGIPPWVRVRTPVWEQDGRVRWIGGIGPAHDWDGPCPRWRCELPGGVSCESAPGGQD